MFYIIVLFTVIILTIGLFVRRGQESSRELRLSAGTHVIISGGSKGIGKSLAKKFAQLGAHVTIIARNEQDLQNAKEEIEKQRKSRDVQKIRTVSLDLTKITFPDSYYNDITNQQKELIEKIVGEHERCDILVNCCGSAIAARFEDITQQQFNYMMQVNYFSAVNLTRILLPIMKARSLSNKAASRSYNGRIVFVSSICGLVSFYGYSAYSASKFALVGLAESLNMELKPFDIGVTIAFPPDTDTPGFEEENLTKPSITAEISKTGNVYNADEVAQSIVKDIRAKKFSSTVGLENLLVLMTANAFMPIHSTGRLFFECLLAGPLKLIAHFIQRSWYKLVHESAYIETMKAQLAMSNSKDSKFYEKYCGNRAI